MKKILPGDKNINRKTNSYHICQNLSIEEAIKSEYLCECVSIGYDWH